LTRASGNSASYMGVSSGATMTKRHVPPDIGVPTAGRRRAGMAFNFGQSRWTPCWPPSPRRRSVHPDHAARPTTSERWAFGSMARSRARNVRACSSHARLQPLSHTRPPLLQCSTLVSTRTTAALRAAPTPDSASLIATLFDRRIGVVRPVARDAAAPHPASANWQLLDALQGCVLLRLTTCINARNVQSRCAPSVAAGRFRSRRLWDRRDAVPVQHLGAGWWRAKAQIPDQQGARNSSLISPRWRYTVCPPPSTHCLAPLLCAGDDLGRPPEPVHRRALLPIRSQGGAGAKPLRSHRLRPARHPPVFAAPWSLFASATPGSRACSALTVDQFLVL
jgi:hypothetical protein